MITKESLQAVLNEHAGCGDYSCVVVRPTGMVTNGGCRCFKDLPQDRRIKVHRLIHALKFLIKGDTTPTTVTVFPPLSASGAQVTVLKCATCKDTRWVSQHNWNGSVMVPCPVCNSKPFTGT